MAAVATVIGIGSTTLFTSANDTWSVSSIDRVAFGRWKHPGMIQMHREYFPAVQSAIDAHDFTAFQSAVADSLLADKVDTQEKFDQFVQMHESMQSGDQEGAKTIADELSIPLFGHRQPYMRFMGNPAVKEAIDAGDYTAFVVAQDSAGKWSLSGIDNEEEFQTLVEMHQLLDEGKVEEAKALADTLDLPHMRMFSREAFDSWHMGFGPEIQNVIEARDFTAFQSAVAGSSLADKVDTQEKFDQFIQMHESMQSGDQKGAKTIADELGLPQHLEGGRPGFGRGMHEKMMGERGTNQQDKQEMRNVQ